MNLEKLKKLAEAATPGPWTLLSFQSVISVKNGKMIASKKSSVYFAKEPDKDFSFIAAANPATVLKLIDRLEKLERVAEAASLFDHYICYCDDMDLMNGESGPCNPCKLRQALADLEGES